MRVTRYNGCGVVSISAHPLLPSAILQQEVNSVIADADVAADMIISLGKTADELRGLMLNNLSDGFCTAVPDLEAATGIDFDALTQKVTESLNSTDFPRERLAELREGLAEAETTSQNVAETTENISVNDWQSLVIIIPFGTSCFCDRVYLVLPFLRILLTLRLACLHTD